MSHKLSSKSIGKMNSLHDDMKNVVIRANEICNDKYGIDFGVGEAARTISRQKQMIATGASSTMNSRHLVRPTEDKCHAVDLCPYVNGAYTEELKHFQIIAKAMFQAAIELGVQIEWGGLWSSFKDCPHYQLSWSNYP